MPEVKWVWDYERRDLGSWPTDYKGHNKPTPVLTLDQIEAWLKGNKIAVASTRNWYLDDLLAQVQAWRNGEK